jgi:hypothetical protein
MSYSNFVRQSGSYRFILLGVRTPKSMVTLAFTNRRVDHWEQDRSVCRADEILTAQMSTVGENGSCRVHISMSFS